MSSHSEDSVPVITSLHNQGIKRARSLLKRKGRLEERAFLVEGVRSVKDAIAAGVTPRVLYLRDDAAGRALALGLAPVSAVRIVSADVLASLSDVPHPQGVVAVVPMDAVELAPRYDVHAADLILVADGVRDPGNLGTLIRTAAGAGATEVIVTPASVDPFNPKCVRSAMAAQFLAPLRTLGWPDVRERLQNIDVVAILEGTGSVDYDAQDWTGPCAIVVGSEAHGPCQDIREIANVSVRIPMARGLESLNAGVAGSLVVLEAARQRRVGI